MIQLIFCCRCKGQIYYSLTPPHTFVCKHTLNVYNRAIHFEFKWAQNQTDMFSIFSRKCRSERRKRWVLVSQRFELSSPTGTKSFKVTAPNSRYITNLYILLHYTTFVSSSNSSCNNNNIQSILCTR